MTDQDKGLKLLRDILRTIDERLKEQKAPAEPLEGQTETSQNGSLKLDQNQIPTSTTSTTIINHHHHHSSPWDYMWFRPRPSVVIIKEDKKKEDKKDNDFFQAEKVAALAVGIGAALYGTYHMATKDEYATFWASDLDAKMKALSEYKTVSRDLLEAYKEWKILFEKRTKPQAAAKVGTFGSIVIGCGGVLLSSPPFIVVGVVGAAASGCIWIWKKKHGEKGMTEVEAFQEFYQLLTTQIQQWEAEGEPGGSHEVQDTYPPPSAPHEIS